MPATHLLRERDNPGLLSIVIPAFNEEQVIPLLRERLAALMPALPCPVEIIIVNDGSTDRTLQLLMDWAAVEPRVKMAALARNFGHQAALTAGLDIARGDAVVALDADLQDPPEVIPEMLRRYRMGYDVVYGQRTARDGESAFKRFTAWVFYRLMRRLVYRDLPPDTGDFRLVSRRCLDALQSMRETHRFLRGMVAWVGFAQTSVPYHRQARSAGQTKYPPLKMLRFAWTAAISFSPVPLRLSLLAGLVIALAGLAYGAYAVVRVLLGQYVVQGWASTITVTCVIGGMILVSIGVLGEYIGRIFESTKHRPLYIIADTANIEPRAADGSGGVISSLPASSGGETGAAGAGGIFLSGDPSIHRKEAEFHDRWASDTPLDQIAVRQAFESSTAMENRFILGQMGDLRGRKLLDIGAGLGESSVYFALQGADVTATDLSPQMVQTAVELGRRYNVSIRGVVCPAESLDLPDGQFDLVYIANTIHHVTDRPALFAQMRRVLRPGGRFFSWDPLAYNPVINIYRRMATSVRTEDESPLTFADVSLARRFFSDVHHREFWISSLALFLKYYLIDRVHPNADRYWKRIYRETPGRLWWWQPLRAADAILTRLPLVRRLAWNMVMYGRADTS